MTETRPETEGVTSVAGELVVIPGGSSTSPSPAPTSLASAAEFSPWASEILKSLERAGVAERRVIAERLRDEVRTAVDCIGTGIRSIFEACAIVIRRQLHVDLGYGSFEEWHEAEVIPQLVEVSKSSVSKLKSAVHIYGVLADKYPGAEIKAHYTTLSLLDAEYRRQESGSGIPEEDLVAIEQRLIEGSIPQHELERELREKRKALRPMFPRGKSQGQEVTQGEGESFRAETFGRSSDSEKQGPRKDQIAPEAPPRPVEERRVVVDPMAELDRVRSEMARRRPANAERVPKVVTRVTALATELRELLSEIAILPMDAWSQVPEMTLRELPAKLRDLTEEASSSSQAVAVALGYLGVCELPVEADQMDAARDAATLALVEGAGFRAETDAAGGPAGDDELYENPFADESAA